LYSVLLNYDIIILISILYSMKIKE